MDHHLLLMHVSGKTHPQLNRGLLVGLTAAAGLLLPLHTLPAQESLELNHTIADLDNLLAQEETGGLPRQSTPLPPLNKLVSEEDLAADQPSKTITEDAGRVTIYRDPAAKPAPAPAEAGRVTVYEEPAPAPAPVETKPEPAPVVVTPVETKPEPVPVITKTVEEPAPVAVDKPLTPAEKLAQPVITTAPTKPAPIVVAPVEDPIVPEEPAGVPIVMTPEAPDRPVVELPPALNNLPELPPLEGPQGAVPSSEPDPGLFAGPDAGPGAVETSSISTNVTINLIQKLVERGALTQADATELIQVAHAEAELARAQVAKTEGPAGAQGGSGVRVAYVPDIVKEQIRDEVRESVMAQAKAEGWAQPDLLPDWVNGVDPFADVRVRYEYSRFPTGNDNTGAFPIFNTINTGSPFDVSGLVFSPQYNVDQDRQRLRLRARFGAEFMLEDGFSAGLRLATGESSSPTSPNQTLGSGGGNFSKYNIWLDRAFLKWELGGLPEKNLAISFGRFDNPFFSTDIVWDDDLGFDGVALSARYEVVKGVTPFVAGGIFPVYNTEFNYATNQPSKFESEDKWLYGAQIGLDWKITEDIKLKVAAAYYDFNNIEGRLSTPYIPLSASDAGDTDATRPSFAQKGNTYRPLRNIIASPLNDYGTSMQYQYFGLATPFREVAYTGRLEIDTWEPYQIALVGEYVQNLDFDQEAIDAIAVNNRGVSDFATGSIGTFAGGDKAWFAGAQIGKGKFEKRWDWNATFGYRYVESDAVVDAFTDSDFGGGGTNMQGYVIGASVALSPNVRLGLRYMTADEIAGPPLKSDIIQIDLNAKF
jgi:hypothetical protein